MKHHAGIFTISLDFELYWGLRDLFTLEEYMDRISGGRKAVPYFLEQFKTHQINATWAIVGFLFCKDKQELLESMPLIRPGYKNQKLSPYPYIESDCPGNNESVDPYHFAGSLIELIKTYPGQEIGTHTFSHYYCLEEGQTGAEFRADLEAAIAIARKRGIDIRSLVFPRNQYNKDYIETARQAGITAYRGNESSWLYRASSRKSHSFIRKIIRRLDDYINLSGYHCYNPESLNSDYPLNIPSSRFLRPYLPSMALFEPLRLRRITSAMTHAAKNGLVYHLWWHPHNFGVNTKENRSILNNILAHYLHLNKQYGMRSMNMSEIANNYNSFNMHEQGKQP